MTDIDFSAKLSLYIYTFLIALFISFISTPVFRAIAIKLNILDRPITQVKTHSVSTPYLGGMAVAFGWFIALLIIRIYTVFPTGTLRSLRGIIYASALMVCLGFIDDAKRLGLGYKPKLFIQLIAAIIVVVGFDIRISFMGNYIISVIISLLWVVGITNALNIIDIMDGLSSGIAAIAAMAFLFISLPTEMIYVNFCAAALAGALLGFLPFNLSKTKKIFLGDAGSLFMGLVLSTLAMGTSYTSISDIGAFAPIIILIVPIYETFLVSYFRLKKGKSPFLGSKDHYALRMEKMGFSRKQILLITYSACIVLSFCAYLFTVLPSAYSILLLVFTLVILWMAGIKLSLVKVD
jgi:UDP-GlcNAc:undecaprenyl-phosphate GlcNAc-1-phosphate transferase